MLFLLVIVIFFVNIGCVVFMLKLFEVMLMFRLIVLIVFIIMKYFMILFKVSLLWVMFVEFFVDV